MPDRTDLRGFCAACLLAAALAISVFIPHQPGKSQDEFSTYLPVLMKFGLARTDISGKVFSAVDVSRTGIPNVLICIKHTGTCALTDEAGNYHLDQIFSGPIILQAREIETPPTFALFERVVFLDPETLNIIDIPLSPIITESGYRIVLSWKRLADGESVDLDANFWLPSGPDTGYHVTRYIDISVCKNFGSAGSGVNFPYESLLSWPYAYLDVDSTTGSELETISIGRLAEGFSTYAVLHAEYAGNQTGEYLPLAASGAVVELYNANGLVQSFSVPPSNDSKATWWHVFNIYDNGDIEVVNTIGGAYPVENYICVDTNLLVHTPR